MTVPTGHASLRLPRALESEECHAAVQAALAAAMRPLWVGGTVAASVVPLTHALRRALRTAMSGGMVRRGLEAAESALEGERRGLDALPAEEALRHGGRVSRLLLVANDGAERFYRRVERLVVLHAPRVHPCVIECDSPSLGALLYGPGEVTKVVLVERKAAVVAILRALARR
jgi:hypothetical protein